MIARLGDGVEGMAETLGGGPLGNDEFTTGAKGGLFLGLRPARHEQNLLGIATVARAAPILGHGETGGGGDAGGGDGSGGDSGAGGGDAGGDGGGG